jgi:hypothetical protein
MTIWQAAIITALLALCAATVVAFANAALGLGLWAEIPIVVGR